MSLSSSRLFFFFFLFFLGKGGGGGIIFPSLHHTGLPALSYRAELPSVIVLLTTAIVSSTFHCFQCSEILLCYKLKR